MRSTLLRHVRVVPLPAATSGGAPETPSAPVSREPVDVLVTDGRVAAVEPRFDPAGADDVVDLDGRWLLPGLWDAHTHVGQWALARRRVDVAAAASADEVAAILVEHARRVPVPDGAFLVGFGFRDGLWERPPTAADLDDAFARAGLPPTPTVVVCGDLHSAWLSTAALDRLGARAGSGGVLREDDWFPLMARIDAVPADVLDAWVGEAVRDAARRGVVGVVDFELSDNLADWTRRIAAGTTGVRVVAGVWRDHLDGVLARGLATGDVVVGTGGLLRQGPLKVISDGSLNTRTAYCHDPYPGVTGPAAHGVLNVWPDELVPLMAHAARHGVHSAIHAIGDRAVGLALDAFEASGAHGSIEHAQLLAPDDVPRFAALGVTASVQPEHAMDDRDVVERYWAERADRVMALRTLHDAGAVLAFGSDAPVAPLDPWAAVSAAVSRSRDGRAPWHPEQVLPVGVALASSVRSRVAPGEPADLVVLDADPLAADGDALRGTAVAGTLLGGRWTHRAL